jgi:hypothetical protein
MHRLLLFVAFASSSILPVFGQNPTTPHVPVIVAQLVLKAQTQALGSPAAPIALFTPTHDGIYRVNLYIGQTEGVAPCSCAEIVLTNGSKPLTTYWEEGTTPVIPFLGIEGQAVDYYTEVSGLPSPYDLIVVIEEL